MAIVIGVANMLVTHDKAANLAKIGELADLASQKQADLLVLPEVALQGYADFSFASGSAEQSDQLDYYKRTAETIPGPATDAVQTVAARTGMVIQVGMAEQDTTDGTIYNSVAVVDGDGVLGSYRKLHNKFEAPYFASGRSIEPVDTRLGLIGPLICYDLAFPEQTREYALRGARILTLSTAWPMKGHDRDDDYYGMTMDLMCSASAFFNQAIVACSNHCERGVYTRRIDYYGGSQIVGPDGRRLVTVGFEEDVLTCEVDPVADVDHARNEAFFGHSLLMDRRPECYEQLIAGKAFSEP